MALHDADILVEFAVKKQADGLVGNIGTINDGNCK